MIYAIREFLEYYIHIDFKNNKNNFKIKDIFNINTHKNLNNFDRIYEFYNFI